MMARAYGPTFLVWSPIDRTGVSGDVGWKSMYFPDVAWNVGLKGGNRLLEANQVTHRNVVFLNNSASLLIYASI